MTETAQVSVGVFVALTTWALPLTLVHETLRAANRLSGQRLIDIAMYSLDGKPIAATSGATFPVAGRIEDVAVHDVLVVLVNYLPPDVESGRLVKAIKAQIRQGATIWAIDNATLLLAEAGLIGGRRVAANWEVIPSITERWPDLKVTGDLYCEDGPLMTCGGAMACLDMTLQFIRSRFGGDLARDIADELLYASPRPPTAPQRLEDAEEDWREPPALARAIEVMETNVESPLTIHALAAQVGVSVRQLENLTRRHLQETPVQRYRLIRLKRARELLLHSQLSITEVAVACGFTSISSFSRAFREALGVSPRGYRERYRRDLARPYIRLQGRTNS